MIFGCIKCIFNLVFSIYDGFIRHHNDIISKEYLHYLVKFPSLAFSNIIYILLISSPIDIFMSLFYNCTKSLLKEEIRFTIFLALYLKCRRESVNIYWFNMTINDMCYLILVNTYAHTQHVKRTIFSNPLVMTLGYLLLAI
jgi:hypothetical protein